MIYGILILAAILRFIGLDQSLWLDEAIGALAVKHYSFVEIISQFLVSDNHPPLYYLLLDFWTEIWGYSEVALRSLSVLFGLGTVFLIFLLAREMNSQSKCLPLMAALLLATSQIHVYYSQEARMYVPAAFFVTLAVYFFLKEKWFGYSLALLGMLFTDYLPVFMLPVFWLWAFFQKKSKAWWQMFILAHVPLVFFGLLWSKFFFLQSARGKWLLSTLPQWKTVAGGATLKHLGLTWIKFIFGRVTLFHKQLYYLLVGIASLPFLWGLKKAWTKKDLFFWLWLVLPLFLAFSASIIFPAFIYFRLIYVLPALYLLVARGLEKWVGVIVLINVLALGIYFFDVDGLQQREKWRQAVAWVEQETNEKAVVIFDYPQPFAPYQWYAQGKIEALGVTDSISAHQEPTQQKTEKALLGKQKVYYFEYLKDLTDPQGFVEKTVKDQGFEVTQVFGDFQGVGKIYLWER